MQVQFYALCKQFRSIATVGNSLNFCNTQTLGKDVRSVRLFLSSFSATAVRVLSCYCNRKRTVIFVFFFSYCCTGTILLL
jgi:hypothetical protein